MSLINKKQSTPRTESEEALSQQEIKFILNAISQAKFEGKDVFFVSSLVQKLSDKLDKE
jgi:hypothetical protein